MPLLRLHPESRVPRDEAVPVCDGAHAFSPCSSSTRAWPTSRPARPRDGVELLPALGHQPGILQSVEEPMSGSLPAETPDRMADWIVPGFEDRDECGDGVQVRT